jgi:hypothetical protein
MISLSKWNVSVEYGPATTDIKEIVVDAASLKGAILRAEKWAKENNIDSPVIGIPYKDDFDEDYGLDNFDDVDFISSLNYNLYDSER